MTTQKILYEAFLKTILKVGIKRFKETSLFGSNAIRQYPTDLSEKSHD